MQHETRQQRRARIAKAQKLYSLPAGKFEQIDMSKREHPIWMTRAYINNRYVVMINDKTETDKGHAIRAMIQRHDDTPIPGHWAELRKIKNELFGAETTAVEYYPAESRLTNDHNIYWLFIFPDGVLPIPK